MAYTTSRWYFAQDLTSQVINLKTSAQTEYCGNQGQGGESGLLGPRSAWAAGPFELLSRFSHRAKVSQTQVDMCEDAEYLTRLQL